MVTQIDYAILNYIQNLRNPFLDTIMPYITYLGSGGTLWIAITVILLIRAKTRKIGITSALALVISAAVFILGVKNIVARERPFNQAAGLFDSASLLIFPPSDRYSFPSGHTVSSFASAMAIFISNRKWGTVCLAAAAVIGFSRLYLYVHFPSDVIFGVLFGILCALAADRIIQRFTEKKNEKKLSDNS